MNASTANISFTYCVPGPMQILFCSQSFRTNTAADTCTDFFTLTCVPPCFSHRVSSLPPPRSLPQQCPCSLWHILSSIPSENNSRQVGLIFHLQFRLFCYADHEHSPQLVLEFLRPSKIPIFLSPGWDEALLRDKDRGKMISKKWSHHSPGWTRHSLIQVELLTAFSCPQLQQTQHTNHVDSGMFLVLLFISFFTL